VLTADREARRKLAFLDLWEACDGDPDELRRRIEHLIALNERLYTEQAAESGYMPSSFAGCVGVLAVAARILELIAEGDDGVA
jgi:hypothetical protein